MALLVWQDDLNTGIELIDHQHMRIVEMLNHLHLQMAQKTTRGNAHPSQWPQLIDELIDYTLSHFSFEENLMEEAHYPFRHAHKRVHTIIGTRLDEYRQRACAGEDISSELYTLFERWLFDHIRGDDKAYVVAVKKHLAPFIVPRKRSDSLSRKFKQLWHRPIHVRTEYLQQGHGPQPTG